MAAKFAKFLFAMLLSVPISGFGLIALLGLPKIQALSAALMEHVPKSDKDRSAVWEEEIVGDPFGHSAPRWDETIAGKSHLEQRPADSGSSRDLGNPMASALAQAAFPEPAGPQGTTSHPVHQPSSASVVSWPQSGMTQATSEVRSSSASGTAAPVPFPNSSTGMPPQPAGHASAVAADAHAGAGPLLTWREASQKLAEVGIERYHLEPGATGNSFLFVCLFSPADAPQVTHRFEAEADDPLLAVNRALQQVDHWMRERHASRNFPTSRSLSFQATTEPR